MLRVLETEIDEDGHYLGASGRATAAGVRLDSIRGAGSGSGSGSKSDKGDAHTRVGVLQPFLSRKDFQKACLAKTRIVISDLDSAYTDEQLRAVLTQSCDLSEEFPHAYPSHFCSHEACLIFADELVEARRKELDHGQDSDEFYVDFCDKYHELLKEGLGDCPQEKGAPPPSATSTTKPPPPTTTTTFTTTTTATPIPTTKTVQTPAPPAIVKPPAPPVVPVKDEPKVDIIEDVEAEVEKMDRLEELKEKQKELEDRENTLEKEMAKQPKRKRSPPLREERFGRDTAAPEAMKRKRAAPKPRLRGKRSCAEYEDYLARNVRDEKRAEDEVARLEARSSKALPKIDEELSNLHDSCEEKRKGVVDELHRAQSGQARAEARRLGCGPMKPCFDPGEPKHSQCTEEQKMMDLEAEDLVAESAKLQSRLRLLLEKLDQTCKNHERDGEIQKEDWGERLEEARKALKDATASRKDAETVLEACTSFKEP